MDWVNEQFTNTSTHTGQTPTKRQGERTGADEWKQCTIEAAFNV